MHHKKLYHYSNKFQRQRTPNDRTKNGISTPTPKSTLPGKSNSQVTGIDTTVVPFPSATNPNEQVKTNKIIIKKRSRYNPNPNERSPGSLIRKQVFHIRPPNTGVASIEKVDSFNKTPAASSTVGSRYSGSANGETKHSRYDKHAKLHRSPSSSTSLLSSPSSSSSSSVSRYQPYIQHNILQRPLSRYNPNYSSPLSHTNNVHQMKLNRWKHQKMQPSGRYNSTASSSSKGTATSNSVNSLGSSLINSVKPAKRKGIDDETSHFKISIKKSNNNINILNESEKNEENKTYNLLDKRNITQNILPIRKIVTKNNFTTELTQEKRDNANANAERLLEENYEYIRDPAQLKTDISALKKSSPIKPYNSINKYPQSYIFPLNKIETRLWELRNKIPTKKPIQVTKIESLRDYSFFHKTLRQHATISRTSVVLKLMKLKNCGRIQKLRLNQKWLKFETEWEKDMKSFRGLTPEEEDVPDDTTELDESENDKFEEEDEFSSLTPRTSSRSSRINRADFVDDSELEDVLFQIDPDYRNHQLAADIPPLILSPVTRYAQKFQDTNNLITDKNRWASRIITDGIDTFTENESGLFLKGYLRYPKKFGKISKYMGGLRSCEECVQHYYKTKRKINYKSLIKKRNMKRGRGSKKSTRKNDGSEDSNSEYTLNESDMGASNADTDSLMTDATFDEEDSEHGL
ncbi:hypothetical protein NCAS_0I03120 [Naumovozyma castellii]|uniref:SANT domain-containing protein n=1 Tax=Naumovozyma castellii TaxID=27288 RepID=G0VKE6_NAUCA|nr:hypothetical protein NCAS_0I03120 [Naumovozyma castellii CBS 4309]CCC71980.1 hypothetical protein NCAS_0I03120 [Naumovozyma castellii CBS 4309]